MIVDSMLLNYKTWILFIGCSTILCDNNIYLGVTTFLYIYFIIYIAHYLFHVNLCYTNMYSIAHCYHHVSSDFFSLAMNGITEFLMAANIIAIKHIYESFFTWKLWFINEWVSLFAYIVYTTIHNINYSYLRINNYHMIFFPYFLSDHKVH